MEGVKVTFRDAKLILIPETDEGFLLTVRSDTPIVNTDMDGYFEFTDVPPGRYMIFLLNDDGTFAVLQLPPWAVVNYAVGVGIIRVGEKQILDLGDVWPSRH